MTIYWLDTCDGVAAWEILINNRPTYVTFQAYDGDWVSPSACTRLFMANRYDALFKARKAVGVDIPPTDGKYIYYFGFWIRVKQFNVNQRPQAIYLTTDDDTLIAGLTLITSFDPMPTLVYGVNPGDIQYGGRCAIHNLDTWYHYELYVSPSGAKAYRDGVLVGQDTYTRVNRPPRYLVHQWTGPNGGNSDILFDDVTLSNVLFVPVTLTVASSVGGTVFPSVGEHVYAGGETVVAQAFPDTGYYFHRFILNGKPSYANPYPFTITKNSILYAEFIDQDVQPPIKHVLEISSQGEGVTDPSTGQHYYDEGDTASVTASPATGWVLYRWVLDGYDAGSDNPITFDMNSDRNLRAVFAPEGQTLQQLSLSVYGQGTTTPTPGIYFVPANSTITVTATPLSGWRFDHWEENGADIGAANPVQILLDSDKVLVAFFTTGGPIPPGALPWWLFWVAAPIATGTALEYASKEKR